MSHPHHMAHILGAQCCDLPTSREWLRALASNLSHIRTWWVVPMVVAHLLVHVADIIAYLRRGQTAVLTPVRSGGGDYSVRATAAGVSPMLFGGDAHAGTRCCTRGNPPKHQRIILRWVTERWRVMSVHPQRVGPARVSVPNPEGTVTA